MKSNLLIQALKTFTKSEIRKFSTFIHSDYFNKNVHLRNLFIHLQQYWPAFNTSLSDRKQLWPNIFPNEPYAETKINNLFSDLLQLLYQFLSVEAFQGQQEEMLNHLQLQLIRRDLLKHSYRIDKKWEHTIERSTKDNIDKPLLKFQRFHCLDQLSLKKTKRSHDLSLQLKSDNLDHYYALQQLKIYAEMLSRGNIVQGGYRMPYLNEILDRYYAEDSQLARMPAAEIYVNIIRMLQDDEPEERFKVLNRLFEIHHQIFESENLRYIYNYLLNFCVKKINSGDAQYYRRIFQIYQLLINQNLLLQNGYCSQWTYTNICTTGIRLGELEWTETFLHNYAQHLAKKDQENAFQYNLATLRFEKKEYNEALQQLLEVEFTDAFYQMAAKLIQLKIYYVLLEFDAMTSLIKATRKFILRNHQLSEYHRKSNQGFLKILQQLGKLKQDQPFMAKSKWKQLRTQLAAQIGSKEKPLSNRDWLEYQIELLRA